MSLLGVRLAVRCREGLDLLQAFPKQVCPHFRRAQPVSLGLVPGIEGSVVKRVKCAVYSHEVSLYAALAAFVRSAVLPHCRGHFLHEFDGSIESDRGKPVRVLV